MTWRANQTRQPLILRIEPGKDALAEAIRKEVFNKKRNYAIAIVGQTQIRKSSIAVSMAINIDETFDLETQLGMIQSENFLEVLTQKIKRGMVLLLDEFEVGAYHRSWYSFLNRALNFIMSTHGHSGSIVIVTTPHFDYIDSDTQKLFDMTIKIVKKNDRKKYVIADVKTMEWNSDMKQFYYQKPRVIYPDGTTEVADFLKLHYPPAEILERYFEISGKGKLGLAAELKTASVKMKVDELKRGNFSPETYAERIISEPSKFIREYRGRRYVSLDIIMNEFKGIGARRANQIKVMAEGKLGDQIANI